MAHSWARDSKVGINSKQLDAGTENKTVLSSCLSPAEFDVRLYFTAFKCFSILLVRERGWRERKTVGKFLQRLYRNTYTLQPYVHIFAFKKNMRLGMFSWASPLWGEIMLL